jgi:hypothetical protein
MSTENRVSVKEAEKHMSDARDPIGQWLEHRGLTTHGVGHLWNFKLSEVDEWVHAGNPAEEPSQ